MLQAVMTEPGRIELREVDRPTPRDNQVIIQIKRIGVCGSDIHVFHGLHPHTSYPVVQGHEVSRSKLWDFRPGGRPRSSLQLMQKKPRSFRTMFPLIRRLWSSQFQFAGSNRTEPLCDRLHGDRSSYTGMSPCTTPLARNSHASVVRRFPNALNYALPAVSWGAVWKESLLRMPAAAWGQ